MNDNDSIDGLVAGLSAVFGKGSVTVLSGDNLDEILAGLGDKLKQQAQQCECSGCRADRALPDQVTQALGPVVYAAMRAMGCDNPGDQMRLEINVTRSGDNLDFEVENFIRRTGE